jgi:hypothetical protein
VNITPEERAQLLEVAEKLLNIAAAVKDSANDELEGFVRDLDFMTLEVCGDALHAYAWTFETIAVRHRDY